MLKGRAQAPRPVLVVEPAFDLTSDSRAHTLCTGPGLAFMVASGMVSL